LIYRPLCGIEGGFGDLGTSGFGPSVQFGVLFLRLGKSVRKLDDRRLPGELRELDGQHLLDFRKITQFQSGMCFGGSVIDFLLTQFGCAVLEGIKVA
jgi:hypothetical protein